MIKTKRKHLRLEVAGAPASNTNPFYKHKVPANIYTIVKTNNTKRRIYGDMRPRLALWDRTHLHLTLIHYFLQLFFYPLCWKSHEKCSCNVGTAGRFKERSICLTKADSVPGVLFDIFVYTWCFLICVNITL